MKFKVNSTGMILDAQPDTVLYNRIKQRPNDYEMLEDPISEKVSVIESDKKNIKKIKKEVI